MIGIKKGNALYHPFMKVLQEFELENSIRILEKDQLFDSLLNVSDTIELREYLISNYVSKGTSFRIPAIKYLRTIEGYDNIVVAKGYVNDLFIEYNNFITGNT